MEGELEGNSYEELSGTNALDDADKSELFEWEVVIITFMFSRSIREHRWVMISTMTCIYFCQNVG